MKNRGKPSLNVIKTNLSTLIHVHSELQYPSKPTVWSPAEKLDELVSPCGTARSKGAQIRNGSMTHRRFYYSMRQSSIILKGRRKQEEEEGQYAWGEKVTCRIWTQAGGWRGRWCAAADGAKRRQEFGHGGGVSAHIFWHLDNKIYIEVDTDQRENACVHF